MVRILCYHCRECSSETWSGNKDFACCTLWPKNQKWTNKKKKNPRHEVDNWSACGVPMDFPGGAGGKELPASAGDVRDKGLIPGSGRSPGGGHGNPLQCSCLENPMERGAWQLQSTGSQRVGHN